MRWMDGWPVAPRKLQQLVNRRCPTGRIHRHETESGNIDSRPQLYSGSHLFGLLPGLLYGEAMLAMEIKPDDTVVHPTLGRGVVRRITGKQAIVDFERFGTTGKTIVVPCLSIVSINDCELMSNAFDVGQTYSVGPMRDDEKSGHVVVEAEQCHSAKTEAAENAQDLNLYDIVEHPTLGRGVVRRISGTRALIDFECSGLQETRERLTFVRSGTDEAQCQRLSRTRKQQEREAAEIQRKEALEALTTRIKRVEAEVEEVERECESAAAEIQRALLQSDNWTKLELECAQAVDQLSRANAEIRVINGQIEAIDLQSVPSELDIISAKGFLTEIDLQLTAINTKIATTRAQSQIVVERIKDIEVRLSDRLRRTANPGILDILRHLVFGNAVRHECPDSLAREVVQLRQTFEQLTTEEVQLCKRKDHCEKTIAEGKNRLGALIALGSTDVHVVKKERWRKLTADKEILSESCVVALNALNQAHSQMAWLRADADTRIAHVITDARGMQKEKHQSLVKLRVEEQSLNPEIGRQQKERERAHEEAMKQEQRDREYRRRQLWYD